MIEPWEELVRQLREALHDQHSGHDVVIEAESQSNVGATKFDVIVDSTGSSEQDQAAGYASLCDLLLTRRKQGVEQVMGCLLIDGEPDTQAFASGLAGMLTDDTFTPVIPLDRDRASSLLGVESTLAELIDSSTALIEVAASRDPITPEVAATALAEIDELIERELAE